MRLQIGFGSRRSSRARIKEYQKIKRYPFGSNDHLPKVGKISNRTFNEFQLSSFG